MKKKILIAMILSAMPVVVVAETPSFNFVKGGYTEQGSDDFDIDTDGFELAGSFEVNDLFYLSGKHTDASEDFLELAVTTFGVGYQHEIAESTLIYAQVDWAKVVFDRPNSGEFDDQGYQVSIGIRSFVTDSLELDAAVRFLDAGTVDATYGDFNPTYIEVGASYFFTEELAAYASYENESEGNRYSIGLRYDF